MTDAPPTASTADGSSTSPHLPVPRRPVPRRPAPGPAKQAESGAGAPWSETGRLTLQSDGWQFLVWMLENDKHTSNAVRLARYLLASVVLLAVVAGLLFWLVPASHGLAPYAGAAGGAAGVAGAQALRRRRRRTARRGTASKARQKT